MARWDQILSLPVQNPPTLEFSSTDLAWSIVEGWRDNKDRVALIPFARVDDFVRGESANKECPTKFHVEARRRRPIEAPYKVKVDGILEYILYWCSFGPDDHRKGGLVRPSRNTYIPKKKSSGRPNTKRGCTCHFIVKRLIAEPSVALIIYNQDKHVDKKGLSCHGPQDKKASGTRAMYAPYISEELRLRIYSLLYVGVSVESIMQRHNESVERQGGPSNRDDLLTHRYVRRQERSIRRSTYELNEDDAISLSMWVENHSTNVFFYRDFSETDPFTVGIQTEWQLQQMIRFGNRSLLVSNSKFGAHKLKYPIHTLLVFNSENKAIPVAWVISPRFAMPDAYRWMRALYNRAKTKDPSWMLAGFIVDDPLADISAIRDVFQCAVMISLWRVRHAWHKNLMQKCSKSEIRAQMSKRFGKAITEICKGQATIGLFEDFMEDFVDNLEFVEYFKAKWYPRIGFWISALQTLPLASQESSAAIELYHHQLSVRLMNEKDPDVYERVDWLVEKLSTKVHSYFWLDEYPGKDDFSRYWKDKLINDSTSWQRALEILDSDVILEGECAKIFDQHDRGKYFSVENAGTQLTICSCRLSEKGFLCEHIFKANKVYRESGSKSSVSLYQYNRVLIKMLLDCGPFDSLIRDHAVSLSVVVQKQLNDLVGRDNNRTTMDDLDQHVHVTFSDDREVGKANKTRDGDEIEARNTTKGDSNVRVTGGSAPDFDEMNVNPSSICKSPSGLASETLPVNGEKVSIIEARVVNKNTFKKDDYRSQNGHGGVAMDSEPRFIDNCSSEVFGPANSKSENTVPQLRKRKSSQLTNKPLTLEKVKIICHEKNGKGDTGKEDDRALSDSCLIKDSVEVQEAVVDASYIVDETSAQDGDNRDVEGDPTSTDDALQANLDETIDRDSRNGDANSEKFDQNTEENQPSKVNGPDQTDNLHLTNDDQMPVSSNQTEVRFNGDQSTKQKEELVDRKPTSTVAETMSQLKKPVVIDRVYRRRKFRDAQ